MVRGEGGTRRFKAVAVALPLVAVLILVQPLSAEPVKVTITDRQGDLSLCWDASACDARIVWGRNSPPARVGFLDFTSVWLSQEGNRILFGMKLAGDVPIESSSLPYGFERVSWMMWISSSPRDPMTDAVEPMYLVWLTYDGKNYSAELRECRTGQVLETLPFTTQGTEFKLAFSAASIDTPGSFWWSPCTMAWRGAMCSSGCWMLDAPDPGAVPGQMYWDIPWPPV